MAMLFRCCTIPEIDAEMIVEPAAEEAGMEHQEEVEQQILPKLLGRTATMLELDEDEIDKLGRDCKALTTASTLSAGEGTPASVAGEEASPLPGAAGAGSGAAAEGEGQGEGGAGEAASGLGLALPTGSSRSSPTTAALAAARKDANAAAAATDASDGGLSQSLSPASCSPTRRGPGLSLSLSPTSCSPTRRERRLRFAGGRGGSSSSIGTSLRQTFREGFVRTFSRALSALHIHHEHHREEQEQPMTAQRTVSVEELLAGLPVPTVPATKPSVERQLDGGATIAAIKADIEDEENGLFQRFLREAMDLREMRSTPWEAFSPAPGVDAKRTCMRYDMLPPKDVPDVAKRIIKIPPIVKGNSVSWFRCTQDGDAECLVLVQRCASEGIMYSDRFYVEFRYEFRGLPEGGVMLRHWVETVWRKSLPWTHSFLTSILEKKVKADSLVKVDQLVSMLNTRTNSS